MPTFEVRTPQRSYPAVVERGVLGCAGAHLPAPHGKVFVVTTEDVWRHYGEALRAGLRNAEHAVIFLPRGEKHKRLASVEAAAEQMVEEGGDRTSVVAGFGGGIVTDVAGFLAAIYMRGVPVLQIPTTLLAQVDAAVGGKTGVNLGGGKNLIGSFHQPVAVLIDPETLKTLPENEYRAGLFEVVKCGVIGDAELFALLEQGAPDILRRDGEKVERLIAAAVRIKAEVVTADERERDLRRILNFGHTVGHAMEAETAYERFLHGEAVGWGMLIATRLAVRAGMLSESDGERIARCIHAYGPLPKADDLDPDRLMGRLAKDKKALQGKVHFVLPTAIGTVRIVTGIDPAVVREAIASTLQGR